MVCRLNKSLYGLKQAPRAWYSRFATFLVTLEFNKAKLDTSLFVYRHEDKTAYLLLYIDDIVLTASSQAVRGCGHPVADPTGYWSLAGALQYLIFTRLDIIYAVQQVCLHMHDPREPHLTLKRLLRYLRDTVDYSLLLHRSFSVELVIYTDVDWAGAEAEYRAVANGVAEASWLRQLLAELHSPLAKSTLVYCDNISAVYLSTNPVQHQRTKHVAMFGF
ncbi:hypothetical protein U9M48_036091 [Paspalum notatum var. saurae]|uniref:Reverse transcriptase Ty1/copia-type domain-containing protein n=1 Tax=Paspalum notatum var. saurae TaxID=547442 RepID=A0AAQ3X9P1_PASNO